MPWDVSLFVLEKIRVGRNDYDQFVWKHVFRFRIQNGNSSQACDRRLFYVQFHRPTSAIVPKTTAVIIGRRISRSENERVVLSSVIFQIPSFLTKTDGGTVSKPLSNYCGCSITVEFQSQLVKGTVKKNTWKKKTPVNWLLKSNRRLLKGGTLDVRAKFSHCRFVENSSWNRKPSTFSRFNL